MSSEDTSSNASNDKEISEQKSDIQLPKSTKTKQKNAPVAGVDPDRFSGKGLSFKAKIIGINDVQNPRGDKMCQDMMQDLKAVVKQSGHHKPKIIVWVSLSGISIEEEKTKKIIHEHPVHRISFISRDVTDNRAFGYIFSNPDGKHQYFGIKTEKTADHIVLALRDLFQVVFEIKKREANKAPIEKATEATEMDKIKDDKNDEVIYEEPNAIAIAVKTEEKKPEESNITSLLDLDIGVQNVTISDPFAPTATDNDPFAPTAADNDPFAPPPATNDPFTCKSDPWNVPVKNTDTSQNDPFGDTPLNFPPPTEKKISPPPVSGDPFGESKQISPPAAADPFGGDPFDPQPPPVAAQPTVIAPSSTATVNVTAPADDKYSAFQDFNIFGGDVFGQSALSSNIPDQQTSPFPPGLNPMFSQQGSTSPVFQPRSPSPSFQTAPVEPVRSVSPTPVALQPTRTDSPVPILQPQSTAMEFDPFFGSLDPLAKPASKLNKDDLFADLKHPKGPKLNEMAHQEQND